MLSRVNVRGDLVQHEEFLRFFVIRACSFEEIEDIGWCLVKTLRVKSF